VNDEIRKLIPAPVEPEAQPEPDPEKAAIEEAKLREERLIANLRKVRDSSKSVVAERQPDGTTRYREDRSLTGQRVGVGGGTQDRWGKVGQVESADTPESDEAYRLRLKRAWKDGSLAKRPVSTGRESK
jgi:hypothetical protein